mgnify:CR=1 FL=1
MRFAAEINDPTQALVAYHGRLSMREQETTIWMDDRPRPPDYALHTWSGFSTGEWDGDVLVQTATHLKEKLHAPLGPDAQRRSDGAHPLQASREQLPPRDRDRLRPGVFHRALHSHLADLGCSIRTSCCRRIRARKRPTASSSTGRCRITCRARACCPRRIRTRAINSARRARRGSGDRRRCIPNTSRRCSPFPGRT